MRRYETIIILRSATGEEGINKVIDYTKEIITAENGVVIELNKWGLKRLAYLIKKESIGYYIFIDFACDAGAIAEMERRFRIDDSVIKYLTIKTAEEIDSAGAQEAISSAAERQEAEAKEAAEGENTADNQDTAQESAKEAGAEGTAESAQKEASEEA